MDRGLTSSAVPDSETVWRYIRWISSAGVFQKIARKRNEPPYVVCYQLVLLAHNGSFCRQRIKVGSRRRKEGHSDFRWICPKPGFFIR